MNPRIYKLHVVAYNEKKKRDIKEQDEMVWSAVGNYVLSAVTVAVEKCLAGKKAKACCGTAVCGSCISAVICLFMII